MTASAPQCQPMTAKEAMDIGYMIAEDHDRALRSMASEFYPDIPSDSLAKLIHGNKVWLAAQIMKAMNDAEARAPRSSGLARTPINTGECTGT